MPIIHCWVDGPRHYEQREDERFDRGVGSTCMLLQGHRGPHKFRRDDEIYIQFTDSTKEEMTGGSSKGDDVYDLHQHK